MISTIPSTTASSSLVQEAQLFVSLLLARHTFVNDPSEILDLALKLADNLHTDPVNPQDHEPPVVRVLDAHIYTLTGLTLMELIDSEDADLVKASQNGLAKLRHALEQVSERTDSRLQQSLTDGRSSTTPQLHWADALLRVIIAKGETGQGQHRSSEATLEAVDPTIQSHNDQDHIPVEGSTDAKDNNTNDIQVISAHQQYLISRLAKVATIQNTIRTSGTTMTMIDFSLLTRTGYLNVLADLNGF